MENWDRFSHISLSLYSIVQDSDTNQSSRVRRVCVSPYPDLILFVRFIPGFNFICFCSLLSLSIAPKKTKILTANLQKSTLQNIFIYF